MNITNGEVTFQGLIGSETKDRKVENDGEGNDRWMDKDRLVRKD